MTQTESFSTPAVEMAAQHLSAAISCPAIIEYARTLTDPHAIGVLSAMVVKIGLHGDCQKDDLMVCSDYLDSLQAEQSKQSATAKAKSSARSAAKKPKPAPKPEPKPILDTFIRKRGLTDQHFALLLSALQQVNWVTDRTDVDDFVSLFSGKPSNCHVIWNPQAGKGILRDLFRMMLDGGFIECPVGLQYIQILESHFVYPDGTAVRGLKGGYTGKKSHSIINECRQVLLINPRAHSYSTLSEEIDAEFSDIRYDPFER